MLTQTELKNPPWVLHLLGRVLDAVCTDKGIFPIIGPMAARSSFRKRLAKLVTQESLAKVEGATGLGKIRWGFLSAYVCHRCNSSKRGETVQLDMRCILRSFVQEGTANL